MSEVSLIPELNYTKVIGDIAKRHEEISNTDTPAYFISDKAGMDYVEEGYMRSLLNKNFPLWNWEIIKYEFLGDEWIVVHGKLSIYDGGVQRSYDAIASHRIAKGRETGKYVDIGNDLKAANSDCFKVAVNRLCNIADDVYRKRIEDVSLNETQIIAINGYIDKISDEATVKKIKNGIENMSINATNFDATVRRLKSIIGEQ